MQLINKGSIRISDQPNVQQRCNYVDSLLVDVSLMLQTLKDLLLVTQTNDKQSMQTA